MTEEEQQGLSRTQLVLLGVGLVYLAIPNMLFLAGWFTPWVAMSGWGLIVLGVCVVLRGLHRQAGPAALKPVEAFRLLPPILGIALALVLYYMVFGLLGIWTAHGDYSTLRQALFLNLRDAPWPLVLPDGREMSYYLGNMLPPALLARMLPEACGQWCIVFWSVTPILLAIALLSTLPLCGRGRTKKLLLVAASLFFLRDPLGWLMNRGIYEFCNFFQLETAGILAERGKVILINPIKSCIGAYNSGPVALLSTAMILVGGRYHRHIIPLVAGLAIALTPLSMPALGLLALFIYLSAWHREGRAPLWETLIPILPAVYMAALSVLYFQRADGDTHVSMSLCAFGWTEQLLYTTRSILVYALMLLPLWKVRKQDKLYLLTCLYLLLGPFLFIGTYPSETYSGMNEQWLKASPVFTTLLAMFWLTDWKRLPKLKYLILPLCAIAVVYELKSRTEVDFSRYLHVTDDWNGHLYHDSPFLRQSIPPCKEPMVPGVILRVSGESGHHFPGAILPHAPGCDYTRPANRPE